MLPFAEERAALIQDVALGIAGFPLRQHIYSLVDWLGECITLSHKREAHRAGVWLDKLGRGHITLPAFLGEGPMTEALLHECAHFLCQHGAAALFWRESLTSGNIRERRLARRWTAREEAEVREFVRAWHLPSWLMFGDPELIAEEAGCEVQMVCDRMQRLNGQVHRPTGIPLWAAGRCYVLREHTRRHGVMISIRPTTSDLPRFALEIPAHLAKQTLAEYTADLLALTPLEFSLKHEAIQWEPGRRVVLSQALEGWQPNATHS